MNAEPASPQAAHAADADDRSRSPSDGLTREQRRARADLEYNERTPDPEDDDDQQAAAQMVHHEEVIAQIPLANFSVPAGGKVWHARMPHFLQISTAAFDEATWEPEDALAASQQDSQDAGDDVKPRTVPDENVIRWRWTKDELGQVVRPPLSLSCARSERRLLVPLD